MIIDLKEQAGIAMNARGQLSDPIADPQVTLGALAFASDLGRLLWRMKYGQDVRHSGLHRATLLLANRLRDAGRFNRAKFTGITRAAKQAAALSGKPVAREMSDIIERFAHHSIIEWIADLCPRCVGRGVVGRGEAAEERRIACPSCSGRRLVRVDGGEFHIPLAARRDGRGPMLFRDTMECESCDGVGLLTLPAPKRRSGRQICPACQGSGRRAVDHVARARALGVSLDQYRLRWESHFGAVGALLDAIDGAVNDTVRWKLQR